MLIDEADEDDDEEDDEFGGDEAVWICLEDALLLFSVSKSE